MLEPPDRDAHPIKWMLWLASGPGRAWQLRAWARRVRARDPLARYAAAWAKEADEVLRWYAKGSSSYATRLLERLTASVAATAREKQWRRSGTSQGGKQSSTKRRERATAWQDQIANDVKLHIARARHTDAGIAVLVHQSAEEALKAKTENPSAKLHPDTVRKYVSRVRKEVAKKK